MKNHNTHTFFTSLYSRGIEGMLLTGCFALISSCSKPVLELDEKPLPKSTTENYSVNITCDQAQKRALEVIAQFSPASTRSADRRVKSGDIVLDHSVTRSEGKANAADTLFYVVNFENNEGFVVLAADSRTVDVLAVSDEGNLDWQNPGNSTQQFLNNSLAEYQRAAIGSIGVGINPGGSGSGGGGFTPPATNINGGGKNIPPQITYDYDPWVKNYANCIDPLTKTSWEQGIPYNSRMPLIWFGGGTRNYLGCTAIAIAQVMSHHKYPKEYDGHTYNWDAMLKCMSEAPNDDIITFVTMVHNAFPPLSVFYGGNEGTAIHPANIQTVLEKTNYSGEYIPGYDYAAILRSLKANCPTTFTGFERNTEMSSAHTWVIDGHLEYSRKYVKHVSFSMSNGVPQPAFTVNGTQTHRYFHYNLGWGRRSYTYYYAGIFDTDYGITGGQVEDDHKANKSPMSKSNGSHDYCNLIKMWVNIKPNI